MLNGGKSEDEVDTESLYCADVFYKDHDGEKWVPRQ